jgi:hypothetical protein
MGFFFKRPPKIRRTKKKVMIGVPTKKKMLLNKKYKGMKVFGTNLGNTDQKKGYDGKDLD